MSIKTVFFILGFMLPLQAALLISPQDAMKQAFGPDITVKKKNVLLNKSQAAAVSKAARVKLTTRIYRTFTAHKEGVPAGHGILITDKVRTKDAAVLYLISPERKIISIEVVAFNEPPEYIPSETWLSQFEAKSAEDALRVGKDIPAISGATMSARTVTDSARLALAIHRVITETLP